MKAIGLYNYLSIEDNNSLQDVEVAKPEVSGSDLLIAVKAISVNPVDTKIRAQKDEVEATPRILGWDASGELVTTASNIIQPINAENLRKAHAMIEQGNAIGKVVLADWN